MSCNINQHNQDTQNGIYHVCFKLMECFLVYVPLRFAQNEVTQSVNLTLIERNIFCVETYTLPTFTFLVGNFVKNSNIAAVPINGLKDIDWIVASSCFLLLLFFYVPNDKVFFHEAFWLCNITLPLNLCFAMKRQYQHSLAMLPHCKIQSFYVKRFFCNKFDFFLFFIYYIRSI